MQIYDWIGRCLTLLWVSYLTPIGIALSPQQVLAQIVPDATLGGESSIAAPSMINDIPSDRIDGGAIRGANLFHSFREFNVGEGQGVYFSNPDASARILARVTGNNASQILGTLGVLGNADLFLINPNGILFGPNARLDIGGSFIGSTASSIRFANGIEFSAANPQAPPLLTIDVPIGLQYGLNPGAIVNRSADGTTDPTLFVPVGRTFALVGGDVLLEGGTMKASQGRLELGSVGDNSLVNLTSIAQGWALNYDGVQNFRDIRLSQGAIVETSGDRGGDIQVQARRLILTGGSLIFYNNGSLPGGNIDITTSESVELLGGINPAFGVGSEIANSTEGTGTTGNLTIRTRRLIVRDGAFIANQASGEGNAGDLTVLASESVELIGVTPIDDPICPLCSSGLFVQAGLPLNDSGTLPTGNGGNLTIETRRLIVRDGALIGSNTSTAGRAGNLTVRASESVEIIGTNPDPTFAGGIATGVDPGATGNSGNLTVETRRLRIQGGGQIATSTFGEGNGGDLIVNASESIELIGARPQANIIRGSSGLFASAEPGATGRVGELRIATGRLIVRDGAKISADNFGPAAGGNLTLNVGQLSIQNGGTVRAGAFGGGSGGMLMVNAADLVEVTGTGTLGGETINSALFVDSTGTGAAGSLEIDTRTIRLDNAGRLTANSTAGLGNITIRARDALVLRRNSRIRTDSTGEDPGGNLSITTDNLVALENSDITANASNSRGGRVTINAAGIFGIGFRPEATPLSDITASSDLGAQFGGTVQINTPDIDPGSGLVDLPTTVTDLTGLVATNLCAPRQLARSSFVVTGRGGLPPNPNDALTNEVVAVEWATGGQVSGGGREAQSKGNFSPGTEIVEAQGWSVAADGTVILTADARVVTPSGSSLRHPSCNVPFEK